MSTTDVGPVVADTNLANAARIVKLFPFATFFVIIIIFLFKGDHPAGMFDVAADMFGLNTSIFIYAVIAVVVVALVIWQLSILYSNYQKKNKEKSDILKQERIALMLLFETTGGSTGSWTDKTRWGSKEPINTWKGIKTHYPSGRVSKIILPSNNLTGLLSEHALSCLSAIIEIDLRDNELTGPLPLCLPNLKKLEGLYLYDNKMTGTIPLGLANLKHLAGIYLINNSFENAKQAREIFNEKLKAGGRECHVFV